MEKVLTRNHGNRCYIIILGWCCNCLVLIQSIYCINWTLEIHLACGYYFWKWRFLHFSVNFSHKPYRTWIDINLYYSDSSLLVACPVKFLLGSCVNMNNWIWWDHVFIPLEPKLSWTFGIQSWWGTSWIFTFLEEYSADFKYSLKYCMYCSSFLRALKRRNLAHCQSTNRWYYC